jgi:tetratricopeptide (TPR) repeat protein
LPQNNLTDFLRRPLLSEGVAAFFLFGALTAAVFGPSLSHGFVYDDRWTIEHNPALGAAPWTAFFTDARTAARPETGMGKTIYRPLPTLSFHIQKKLGQDAPRDFRLISLALHALNAALLLAVLRRAGIPFAAAAAGAALFLLHPAQVESVAWATQRSNLMMAGAFLGALLCLGPGAGSSPAGLWGGLALYGAALLSKETALVFPLILWAAGFLPGEPRRGGKIFAGLAALTAAYMLLRWSATGSWSQRPAGESPWADLLEGMGAFWEYLKIIIWPNRLTASHGRFIASPLASIQAWAGLALFSGWAAGALVLLRRKSEPARRAGFFGLWIPLGLALVIGFFPTDTFVAERFLYLPLAGVAGLAALGFERLIAQGTRAWRVAAFIVLSALALRTIRHLPAWKNEGALWENAVRVEPANGFAWACLGDARLEAGRRQDAEAAYRAALTRWITAPVAFATLNNLSTLLNIDGKPDEALVFSEKALRIAPDSPEAQGNRARALALIGRKKRP